VGADLRPPLVLEIPRDAALALADEPQADALAAIKYLHQVVEDTVSIFKDHEIKDGNFVRKKVN